MKKLLPLLLFIVGYSVQAQTYCSPVYTTGCTVGDDINSVFIGNFQDTNTGCTSGNYYVSTSDTIFIQQTAPTTVSFTSNYSTQYFAIWGDFNNDGDFDDANEFLWASSTNAWNGNVGSIAIPSSVSLGSYRMRIRSNYSAAISSSESCSSLVYGEVHDYTVTVTAPPVCPAPVFSAITASDTTALISWSSLDTTFSIEYGAAGFVAGLGTSVVVNDTFALIGMLSPNTAYEFLIKTDCTADTNGYSTVVGPFYIKTTCSSVSTPVYESFENDSTGSSFSPNAPSCWYYTEESGASGYGYITNTTWSISPYYGSKYYYLYNSFDASQEALVSPAIIGLDSGTKQMEIHLASTGFSAGVDVVIGTVSSPSNFGSFTAMDTISVPNGGNWTAYTRYFDASTGYNMQHKHIAIATTNSNTYTAVYIDDITISDAPQCLPASALSVGAVLVDSAQISYTTNGIASYLEYGPVGFVPDFQQSTGTLTTATGSPMWITGLDTNTSYDAYVYQMCADSSVSPAFGPVTFKTLACVLSNMCTFSIELTDSYGDGWNGAEVQVINSSGGVEFTLGAGFTTGTSYTETINVCTGQNFTIEVSDPGSYASEIGLNVISNGSTITSYSNSPTTTTGTVMATFAANCNASCPTPSNLTYTAGKNTASFGFDQNGGSGTYVYEWGPQGFIQATGSGVVSFMDSTTSNNFSISGLSSATCYDVFMIAYCGANGTSDTLGPISFCTNLCDTTDLCTYTMSMYDTYGDGWNGAEVSVYYNGVFGEAFTFLTGDSSIVDFQVCSGTEITVNNSQAGSYPTEVYYSLTDASGLQNVSVASPNFAVGYVDTLMANCVPVSCPMPSNVTLANVGPSFADISWTGGTGSFMYTYAASGSTNVMTGSSTSAITSLTGLAPATFYNFSVWEVCAPGDTSMIRGFAFNTDSCTAITVGTTNYNVDSVNATTGTVSFDWSGASGYNSYTINFGDGSNSTGTGSSETHVYAANGSYSATLTLYGDCDTTTRNITVMLNGIGFNEQMGLSSLLMYPNPTTGLITVDGIVDGVDLMKIRVLNYLGQEIVNDDLVVTSGVFHKTYDLSDQAAGAYLIEIKSDRGMVQKPIIIKH